MTPPSSHSPNALLEQVGWIRALARTLIGDPHAAEDLTQDTCIAALQRQPDDRQPLRGWLATVLRNLAVHRRRATSRSARERAAARGEECPPTVDVLDRAEKQRRIAELVIGLAEPYRTTVLLRFFDALPPREIAEWMGVPLVSRPVLSVTRAPRPRRISAA
jgi:RNA polymerase sigma factor (sigma-70 family)